MSKILIGIVIGIVLSTIGYDGVVNIMGKATPTVNAAVSSVKTYAVDAASGVPAAPASGVQKAGKQ